MKRLLLITLLVPAAVLLSVFFVYPEILLDGRQWIFAAVFIVLVWFGFVMLFMNINKQVDDNPYYTQMVIKKRDEVRKMQKIYASSKKQ